MQPLECCAPLVLSYPKSFLSAAEPPLGRAEEGRRCLALRRFLPEGGRDEGWWFVVFSLQREKPTQRVFGSRERVFAGTASKRMNIFWSWSMTTKKFQSLPRI